jgi:L-histidine Nalpha-methyltransferase
VTEVCFPANPVTPLRQLWDEALRAMTSALRLRPGDTGTLDDLARVSGVAPRHEWIVARWLLALEREGIVASEQDRHRVVGRVRSEPVDLDAACQGVGYEAGAAKFYRAVFDRLPAVLCDDVSVFDLLVPGAVESFPDHNNVFVEQLADTCAALAGRLARRRAEPVRVVELGGKAGEVTRMVLEELAELDFSYLFTDRSAASVSAAAAAGVSARVVDVDLELRAQGLSCSSADVVIACDVLHRATDVTAALRGIHEVVVPGGELLLVVRTGDDALSLVSGHFTLSPPGGAVPRGGEIFPNGEWWRARLVEAGFGIGVVVSAGDRLCRGAGYRLFQARRTL